MRNIISILAVTTLFSLAGCATTFSQPSGGAFIFDQQRVIALTNLIKGSGGAVSELYFLDVDSPTGLLAANLMVGMLKAGGTSSTIDSLGDLLKKVPDAQIVITGANDDVTAATVEGTLKRISPSSNYQKSVFWLALNNPSDHHKSLLIAAQAAGVGLETLQFPLNKKTVGP